MKTVGLCFLFLSFILLANAPAQSQSNRLGLNTDKDAIQKWLARKGQSGSPGAEGFRVVLPPQDNNFILSLDDLEPSCMYMRTYRVQRETHDSDVTHPAGYTTCVPVGRFAVKRAAEPEAELLPRVEY